MLLRTIASSLEADFANHRGLRTFDQDAPPQSSLLAIVRGSDLAHGISSRSKSATCAERRTEEDGAARLGRDALRVSLSADFHPSLMVRFAITDSAGTQSHHRSITSLC
jgi:hypothetical protein